MSPPSSMLPGTLVGGAQLELVQPCTRTRAADLQSLRDARDLAIALSPEKREDTPRGFLVDRLKGRALGNKSLEPRGFDARCAVSAVPRRVARHAVPTVRGGDVEDAVELEELDGQPEHLGKLAQVA